jgi:hypothetical protein
MRLDLKLHPDSLCPAVKWIVVEVERPSPTGLKLHFKLAGAIGDLQLPDRAQGTRTADLWQHMCFEFFLRGGEGSYLEFNFSPSTQWAAYEFGGYRSGMSNAPDSLRPAIRFVAGGEGLALMAEIEGLPSAGSWRIGLSAVIEEKSGNKSYWALAHPSGAPDFHHADCFAAELSPVEAP